MIGLVDGNNFFVSCERVVDPSLEGKAVAVLSNNDGCCVSRSNEFKALGIPMGTPYFQLKEREASGELVFRSSNYELYGDISRRIVSILRQESAGVEQYSIDEAFVHPPPSAPADLAAWGAAALLLPSIRRGFDNQGKPVADKLKTILLVLVPAFLAFASSACHSLPYEYDPIPPLTETDWPLYRDAVQPPAEQMKPFAFQGKVTFEYKFFKQATLCAVSYDESGELRVAAFSPSGGKIFIGGRGGTRTGSLMKHDPVYEEPELWVLKNVGSFSFEFMGGGKAVVCGYDCADFSSVLGERPCVGMVGGTVYVRGPDVLLDDVEHDDRIHVERVESEPLAALCEAEHKRNVLALPPEHGERVAVLRIRLPPQREPDRVQRHLDGLLHGLLQLRAGLRKRAPRAVVP